MSEESMVERVARAICAATGTIWGGPSGEDDPDFLLIKLMYLNLARAAIEAMREPTKDMQAAIRPQSYTIEHYHGSGHHRTFPTLGSGPLGAWHDMIDAALKETA